MFIVASTVQLFVLALAFCTHGAPSPQPKQYYATYINFAADDILDGDDGMPPHPSQPHPYGKPTYPITTDGNGREQVEAHLTYFEGKYWMHSATWGCGGSLFVSGHVPPDTYYPSQPAYPVGDYGADGNCGIKSFSSVDFTNWQLENFYQPSASVANVTKPVVRFSKASGQYVMFMGGNALNFYYATSSSPGGPWTNPPRLMGGSNIAHDFDVAVGPDGTHYMVSDVQSQTTASNGVPVWDIWVQQLAPSLTSTLGNETSVLIRTGAKLWADQQLTLEASGFFYYNGYWYLTWGQTVQNGAGYIYYHYAKNPLGPWTDGGFVSLDGCGGQNKGANVLPTTQGFIVLAGNLGYRTSPTNYINPGNSPVNMGSQVYHADNQQAASSTYFFPIEVNSDHTLKNWTCPDKISIPLASTAMQQPEDPIPYRLDCRIRNWQEVQVTFNPPRKGSILQFPVWQRTDTIGAIMNAGPVMNGNLNVQVELAQNRGSVMRQFSWPASNISWAPDKISMDLTGSFITGITLSTNASNGCYGTLVQPKTNGKDTYGTVVNGAQGYHKSSRKAQLYVYQF